jgi:putative ABC transport system ATP-binding protein
MRVLFLKSQSFPLILAILWHLLVKAVVAPSTADIFDLDFENGLKDSVIGSREKRLADLRRRNLGYVLQSGGLLPFLTVGENIQLSCRVNGLGDSASVRGLAVQLGIDAQWDKKPAFLSGGQRQRVAIARALAHSPDVVLADEPREIRNLLSQAAKDRGATVMVVTHDEALLADITNRVFTFRVERQSPNEVVSTVYETSWSQRGSRAN